MHPPLVPENLFSIILPVLETKKLGSTAVYYPVYSVEYIEW